MAQTEALAPKQPTIGKSAGSGAWSVDVKPRVSSAARATSIRITGDANRTFVRLEVTHPVVASMFTLDQPLRAIVDIANLDFKLKSGAESASTGLVKAFRYGQFETGRSRMVIDLAAPATIENGMFTAPSGKQPGILSFELARVGIAEFQAMRGPAGPEPTSDATKQLRTGRHHDEAAPESAPEVFPRGDAKSRPVVVLDPGHGGIDPGTVGAPGLAEKSVTLAVALQVRNLLLKQANRYDVHMTRDSDVFVSLDQRVKLSRQHQADLFVSIHADALAEKEVAQAVRGATVYVLSERASDEQASRLAEKENAADALAGLAAVPASAEDQVRNILLDLVQRETVDYSARFRRLLLGNLRGRVPLAKDPQRAAAFKVLKQNDVPAVLIELGYMTNTEDLARLGKTDGQRQLATAIASSVDAFFAGRISKSGR